MCTYYSSMLLLLLLCACAPLYLFSLWNKNIYFSYVDKYIYRWGQIIVPKTKVLLVKLPPMSPFSVVFRNRVSANGESRKIHPYHARPTIEMMNGLSFTSTPSCLAGKLPPSNICQRGKTIKGTWKPLDGGRRVHSCCR